MFRSDRSSRVINSLLQMLKLDELQLLGEATCLLSEIVTKCTDLENKELFSKSALLWNLIRHGKTDGFGNRPKCASQDPFLVLKIRLFGDKFSESVHHTFLDYLDNGFELSFMVAIDFTDSLQSLFVQ
ncbi:hypothetical protein L1987_05384 [Smallanthus sonchifolius]|uniref:Uncharacterized protein n=1 Tax=Smallanthus sonchifolius TaxID=185202 RepID=A0ACB9JVH7_9ASTR|nr:hypothetical protein L1987_05384 [Smallanthus sonchifolius]